MNRNGALLAVAIVLTSCTGTQRTATRASGALPAPSRPPALPAAAPASQPAAPAPGPPGHVIVIDPGHNGQNWSHPGDINRLVDIGNGTKACDTTGTATRDGYTEAAHDLDVASRLAAVLTRAGALVVLTRSDNDGWGPCVDERAAIGNRAHADVAISIHADGSPAGRGFHVIYPAVVAGLTEAIAAPSERLALDVRGAYARGTGMPYATYAGHAGLAQRGDLGGLNRSRVPKVFIETGNMLDPTDAALLEDPSFRDRAARALAEGLEAFLSGH